LPDLLCHDPKDREHLDHNFHDDVLHNRRWLNWYVSLEPLKKAFHAAKEVYKGISAGADILDGLRNMMNVSRRLNKGDAHLK